MTDDSIAALHKLLPLFERAVLARRVAAHAVQMINEALGEGSDGSQFSVAGPLDSLTRALSDLREAAAWIGDAPTAEQRDLYVPEGEPAPWEAAAKKGSAP